MPRKKASTQKTKEPSFEEAIAELEDIVATIEEEDIPLEELVAKYEHGSRLLTRCESVLKAAKKRLKVLAEAQKNGPDSIPEDTENHLTENGSAGTDLPDEDDDIRLL